MKDRSLSLHQSRDILRERRIDPIWQSAAAGLRPDDDGAETIRKGARTRVLRFLAARMGLDREEADPALFDLEQCRQAWRLLDGVTYAVVRDWATKHRSAPSKVGAAA